MESRGFPPPGAAAEGGDEDHDRGHHCNYHAHHRTTTSHRDELAHGETHCCLDQGRGSLFSTEDPQAGMRAKRSLGTSGGGEHHHRGRGTTHHTLPALVRPLEGRTAHGGRVGDVGDVPHVQPVWDVFGSQIRRDFGLGRERRPRFLDKSNQPLKIFTSKTSSKHFSETKAKELKHCKFQ